MKVGLMGDNGFRAGHVNGNAAAAPALATAEVFGQAAKIGRAVDDLGQDLMHKENVCGMMRVSGWDLPTPAD